MSFVINLFGECIRYWKCSMTSELYTEFCKIKAKTNLPWETLLINLEILNHFGFAHWSELSNENEKKLFLINSENKIEIKQKNKYLLKIKSDLILNQTSLFELFHTEIRKNESNPTSIGLNEKQFIIFQKETGLVAKYLLNQPSFDIYQLKFNLISEINSTNQIWLSSLEYANEFLTTKKEDTLIRSFEINWLN